MYRSVESKVLEIYDSSWWMCQMFYSTWNPCVNAGDGVPPIPRSTIQIPGNPRRWETKIQCYLQPNWFNQFWFTLGFEEWRKRDLIFKQDALYSQINRGNKKPSGNERSHRIPIICSNPSRVHDTKSHRSLHNWMMDGAWGIIYSGKKSRGLFPGKMIQLKWIYEKIMYKVCRECVLEHTAQFNHRQKQLQMHHILLNT